ncbi:unnamed protein product [Paramecium sonneborni]|uniref:Cytochrome P450 n=1 Tax=Paramecium sonneborni TaxID=65129 RepID=A0A8S1NK20_9CILI|nr:unnamed protein product [Paramecium sonneborni]
MQIESMDFKQITILSMLFFSFSIYSISDHLLFPFFWAIVQMQNSSSIQDNHFENALEFNYKRWLKKENVIKNDNGFIHIPFAAGPRNCIGQHMALMEAKIIIALILRNYKIIINPQVSQIKYGVKFLQCVEPDNCLVFQKRI